MTRPLIINFTPTGMIPMKEMTPHVPISVQEIRLRTRDVAEDQVEVVRRLENALLDQVLAVVDHPGIEGLELRNDASLVHPGRKFLDCVGGIAACLLDEVEGTQRQGSHVRLRITGQEERLGPFVDITHITTTE